jgi:hypothetical protein
MDKKVEEDYIRQFAKSIIETHGVDKTIELIKELERLIRKERIKSSYEKAVEQHDEALRKLDD